MKVIIRVPVFCHDVVANPEVQVDDEGNAKFGGFNPVLQPSDTPIEVPATVGEDWIKRGIAEAHAAGELEGDARKRKGF